MVFGFGGEKKEPLLSGVVPGGGGSWPTLYAEAREMLEAAILIYAFADLRRLCESGKLSNGDEDKIAKMKELPIEVGEVLHVVNENTDLLRSEFGDESADYYLAAIGHITQNVRKQVNAETGEAQTSTLVVFDDEHHQEELVYGIAINHARQRVTVAFRGSVTTKDFLTDANAIQDHVPNPAKGDDSRQPSTIGIHAGFRDYLFGTKKGENQVSKCDKIMGEVAEILAEFPGYRLYVTGHSLGGALATLFAFEAAASTDPRVTKPVTCVSVASPKVGSITYRKAFRGLEDKGLLRCLRIANHKDLVTLLPDRGNFSCFYIMCCQSNLYRHVGIGLTLYKDRGHRLTRPLGNTNYFSLFVRDWGKQVKSSVYMIMMLPFVCFGREDFLLHHACLEYSKRLAQCENPLTRMELNNFYQNPSSLQPGDE